MNAVAYARPWKLVTDPIRIRPGDQLKVDGGPAFVVQTVSGSRRFCTEVITSEGLPMDIRDTDYVAIWVDEKKESLGV